MTIESVDSVYLEVAKDDPNCRHPKQKGKFLINNVISRLSESDPELLMELIGNEHFNRFTDILLGLSKFGSCTGHWIEAKVDRQKSHVDYPIHVGSGPFWQNDIERMMQFTTRDQINRILPYFSVQVLIAADAMDVRNGSTEVIPCSHRVPEMDAVLHNEKVYESCESKFVNVDLEQGDFLIFCRRLCHRGGKNLSDARRNALIAQCVYLWGVGQEIIDSARVLKDLETTKAWEEMSEEKRERFSLRLKAPYPLDVSKST